MTPEEIWSWQEQMYVYSCFLYHHDSDPLLTDAGFDDLYQLLARNYQKLSPEFHARCPRADLKSGHHLHFTETEKAAAVAWRDGVRAGTFWDNTA